IIRVNDRGTMLNLMIGLNGYTLCSGIICENLNGNSYKAIKLDDKEIMSVIYIKRAGSNLSSLGSRYVELLKKYKDNVMK
ncbi:MAG: LysR family transcriptional regulator, partial [Butyrivibrio sp.]|nr:LysR family transcriptional regulator [Butyrivibrio sp.]